MTVVKTIGAGNTVTDIETKPKRRPVIGIVAWKLGDNSMGITLPYFVFASYYGEVRIILPNERMLRTDIDLLILPGGPDVDPNRYATYVSIWSGKPDPLREWFDVNMLPLYLNAGTPVFGICRGHQTLAVHFGGKLRQHMYHETNPADDRSKLVHNMCWIDINTNKKNTTKINSIHHQTVYIVPENAQVVGWYNDTMNFSDFGKKVTQEIEALIYPDHNCASVQYHPEELYQDDLTNQLMEWLLSKIDL